MKRNKFKGSNQSQEEKKPLPEGTVEDAVVEEIVEEEEKPSKLGKILVSIGIVLLGVILFMFSHSIRGLEDRLDKLDYVDTTAVDSTSLLISDTIPASDTVFLNDTDVIETSSSVSVDPSMSGEFDDADIVATHYKLYVYAFQDNITKEITTIRSSIADTEELIKKLSAIYPLDTKLRVIDKWESDVVVEKR